MLLRRLTFEAKRVVFDNRKANRHNDRNYAYLMVGTTGAMGMVLYKNLLHDVLASFAPARDVVAQAKVEIDLSRIPEGRNLVVKWRGKPIFIRHRTGPEITEAASVSLTELVHKEADSERVKIPEWLIMIGVCTHLGCIPIGEAGDYNGWYCPCHGSHYDISGRIRKGPAPLNLEIPKYNFIENNTRVVIG